MLIGFVALYLLATVAIGLLMEAVAPEALVPPQLVGLGFSFLGMVVGSLYGRQAPHAHAAHAAGH